MAEHKTLWKSEKDADRIRLYQENTNLYKGNFTRVWKDLKPIDAAFVVVINDARVIVDVVANLLFREPVDILSENQNKDTQVAIDALIKNNHLDSLFKEQAAWTMVKGDSVFLISGDENSGVSIDDVDPRFFFGEFDPLNAKKLIKARFAYPLIHKNQLFVYQQIHEVIEKEGVIRHQLFIADEDNLTGEGVLLERVPLETIPQFAELPRVEMTGVDEILVVHNMNARCPGEPYGVSDYTNSLKSKFKARTQLATQRRSVTSKHMEPMISMPKEVLRALKEQAGNSITIPKAAMKVIGLAPNQEAPQALIWDANLKVAKDEDEILFRQILEEAKIAPELLGAGAGGISGGDTGRAGVMKLQVSLGLANTKQNFWTPSIEDIMRKSQKLDNVLRPADDRYEVSTVNVVWKDGLFSDGLAAAQKEQVLVEAGLSSRATSIQRLTGWTVNRVQEELDSISKEEESSTQGVDPFAGN